MSRFLPEGRSAKCGREIKEPDRRKKGKTSTPWPICDDGNGGVGMSMYF